MVARTSVQVKTHHQKMIEKYQSISSIIHHLELTLRKHVAADGQGPTTVSLPEEEHPGQSNELARPNPDDLLVDYHYQG